jgi:hypothetical protein
MKSTIYIIKSRYACLSVCPSMHSNCGQFRAKPITYSESVWSGALAIHFPEKKIVTICQLSEQMTEEMSWSREWTGLPRERTGVSRGWTSGLPVKMGRSRVIESSLLYILPVLLNGPTSSTLEFVFLGFGFNRFLLFQPPNRGLTNSGKSVFSAEIFK